MFGNALGWWLLCLLKHNVCCKYNTVSWHPWGFGRIVDVNGHIFSILFQWGYPTLQVTNFAMAFKKILGGSTCIVGQYTFNGQVSHTVLYQLTNTSMNVFAEIANGPTANVPYIYVLVGQ